MKGRPKGGRRVVNLHPIALSKYFMELKKLCGK